MSKTIQKTINDNAYYGVKIPALKGAMILKRIIKLVSPSLGEGIDNISGTSFSGFSGIANKLVDQLDKEDVVDLIVQLVQNSNLTVNSQKISFDRSGLTFDDHFAANYDELLDVVTWIIEENYSTFFTKARSLILSLSGSNQSTEEQEQ